MPRPRPTDEEIVDTAAQHASRRLLAAQLRAGQHSLTPGAFWARVRELRALGCI